MFFYCYDPFKPNGSRLGPFGSNGLIFGGCPTKRPERRGVGGRKPPPLEWSSTPEPKVGGFLMCLCITFGSILSPFWHQSACFSAPFSSLLRSCSQLLALWDPFAPFGFILVAFWHPFGSHLGPFAPFWLPVGRLSHAGAPIGCASAPFGSAGSPCGSDFDIFGIPLAPFPPLRQPVGRRGINFSYHHTNEESR